jgi:GRAS domain family
VLDHWRSPSPTPPNSTISALGDAAAVSDSTTTELGGTPKKEDSWALLDLPTVPAGLDASFLGSIERCEDWDTMLAEHDGVITGAITTASQEQNFLHWIMGDVDNCTNLSQNPPQHVLTGPAEFPGTGVDFGIVDPQSLALKTLDSSESGTSAKVSPSPLLSTEQVSLLVPPSLPLGMFFQEETKPVAAPFFHQPALIQAQSEVPNTSFFVPLTPFDKTSLLSSPAKRHHSVPGLADQVGQGIGTIPDLICNQLPSITQFLPRSTKLKSHHEQPTTMLASQNQQLLDSLFEAARMVETGTNLAGVRGILARLNQHLSSPIGNKPLLRSAFYFKEALQLALSNPHYSPQPAIPFDIVLKLSAYKAFSECSPVLQFANFTCTQTLLEELAGSARIHVIDFDLGSGGQWASFMQELAQRHCLGGPSGATTVPVLKFTAFVSPALHQLFELHLTRDNLCQFAASIGIPFEFNLLNLDTFDPFDLLSVCHDEAVAVNLPIGPTHGPSLPTLLHLVKQLAPKIIVSIDHGLDHMGSDLTFTQHFFHTFQSCMFLLDSIDSTGTNMDLANKIEQYIVRPKVEAAILRRYRAVGERAVPWRTLFAGAGFVPVSFSNFTETQAECILKRVQVRGFHVEKRQSALVLYWQRGELVSVSAWRC